MNSNIDQDSFQVDELLNKSSFYTEGDKLRNRINWLKYGEHVCNSAVPIWVATEIWLCENAFESFLEELQSSILMVQE